MTEPIKLKFGDVESIKYKKNFEYIQAKRNYENLVVKCPVCGTRIKQIADIDLEAGWIMWCGCGNPNCQENPSHRNHGMQECWDGMTDLKGKVMEE